MESDTQVSSLRYYGCGYRLLCEVQYIELTYDVIPNLEICGVAGVRLYDQYHQLILYFCFSNSTRTILWEYGQLSVSKVYHQSHSRYLTFTLNTQTIVACLPEGTWNRPPAAIESAYFEESRHSNIAIICKIESGLRKSKTMPRSRLNIISPYGPRPRRSKQLIVLWMGILLFVLVTTYYLLTRRRETTEEYANMLLHGDGSSPRRGSPKMQVVD